MIGAWTRIRIAACGLVMLGLAVWVGGRAVQLQVDEADEYRALAESNYLKEMNVPGRRGRILDRKGVELASTVQMDSVFCNPRQLVHVPGGAETLARTLRLDPKELARRVASSRSYFMWVRNQVTPEESAAVMALELPGVGIRKEPKRVYPKEALAATVIGYAGREGRGLEGVERSYDDVLRGTGVAMVGLRDGKGRALLAEGMVDPDAGAGSDLVLTLDSYISYVSEEALARGVAASKAKAGIAVVIDPRTGDVLALANVPTYNPNQPGQALTAGAKNRAITDSFEPGSTMKTITFAAALEAGAVRPTESIDCEMGRMAVGGRIIRDDHPKGVISAAEVFKHSSNIGTVKIVRRIGRQKLHDALLGFGFGRRTGIGLDGEVRGVVHPVARWSEIGFANHSFGQGLTVTPLQLAAAFSTIAAGGTYRPPRLCVKVIDRHGHESPCPRPAPREERRVMSEAAARTLREIMVGVTEGGTAKQAAIPGYPVAGKTGTSQKVTDGKYGDERVSSFVGIVPADDPRLVIAIVVDEPEVRPAYGGIVAAPIFKEIAEASLRYLTVPPTAPIATKPGKKPTPAGVPAVPPEAERLGSDEPLLEQLSELEGSVDEHEGDAAPARPLAAVPDFKGMSIAEAVRAARRAGIELAPEGSGLAWSQSPRPGMAERGALCRVVFRPGG